MTFLRWRTGRNHRLAASLGASSRNRARTRSGVRVLEQCEDRVLMAVVTLGAAKSFAVLGATTVTNTGLTSIVGDVGVSPGSAITGFPPGIVTSGSLHAGDAVAAQAHADLATAYGVLAGETSTVNLTGQPLGGLTLAPGVYHFDTSAALAGILTLDAQGNPDARFDFQIGTTLTTGSGSSIRLINGGRDSNVFFQVGTSATLGTNTAFAGSILANTSITATTGASFVHGRALAVNGAVTLDSNTFSIPLDPPPVVTSLFPVSVPESATGLTLTVNGTDFVAGSVVLFNGTPLTTVFVGSTQLQVTVPAVDVGEEGTATITVLTPGPGGGLSGPQLFTITDPSVVALGGFTLNATFGTPTGSQTVATFTDPGGPEPNLNDPLPANINAHYAATIAWGDGTPSTPGVLSFNAITGLFTVSGNHTYLVSGSSPITVTINHEGAPPVTVTSTALVGDPGVTSATAVAVHAVEGQNTDLVVLATFIDADPNSTAHDWNAKINWGDASPISTATIVLAGGDPVTGGNVFQVIAGHTYAEEGPAAPVVFNPIATITDVDSPGAVPFTLPLNITLADAALSSQGSTIEAIEGIGFTGQLIATFSDANPGGAVADFTTGGGTVSINWGDGSPVVNVSAANVTLTGGTFSVTGSHTYAESGSFKVTVTANDDGGSQTVAHSVAVVADAALVVSPTQPIVNLTEGRQSTGTVASFTDANPAAPVGDFAATIDWGDGTPRSTGTISQPGGAGSAFLVTGTHTYADAGVDGGVGHFPIIVYVTDQGGSTLTVANTANVADVAITLAGILNPASDSGQSHTDAITNVNQPNFYGTSEPFSHIVLFATPTTGGTPVQIGQTTAGGDGSWSITTNRLLDGSYTITGTATDQFAKTTTGFTVPATAVTFLPNAGQGPLVIDTVGPRVTHVAFDRLNGEVDVVFQDDRTGLNQATVLDSANYALTKPHKPFAAFLATSLNATPSSNPTAPEKVVAVFNGGRTLRGPYFLFTIRDSTRGPSSVQDVAGNSLDGEFYGSFASGNSVPGGDFVAMLNAYHNKVFAPQTVIGTANAANGGQGGLPVGSLHSGIFTHVLPRRAAGSLAVTGRVRQASPVAGHHPHGPRHHG
ncbi:MAG: hypothetical protein JWN86_2262 [Planctomycetota bacterium]|nr:hypothetical protein [Planctomycetota bacterium]